MTKGTRVRTVLVVEDDQQIGEVVVDAINEEHGYTATRVENADEALDSLARVVPDLLLLDIRLPGMSGLELYDRIRSDARFRSLPVVFETSGLEHGEALRERGVATYIKKPFDIDDLVRFIRRLVPPRNGNGKRAAD